MVSSSPLRAFLGPLLTLGTIVAIIIVRTVVPVPSPGILLLLAVALAGVVGGVRSALVSAAFMGSFIAVDASLPGQPFHYAPDSISRLLINLSAAPAMALLVGGLVGRLEHRELDLARARAHERERALTDTVTDAIVTIDRGSTIRAANPAAHEMFGYAENTLVGRSLTELMPDEARRQHLAGLDSYLETGRRRINWQGTELVARHSSGREIPIEVSFAEYGTGADRRFTGVIRDVRHRRDLEEQLRQAQKMDALGQLAGGVAHDFNNILTAVYGFTDLARGGLDTNDEKYEQLGFVIDAATRGRDLVAQLLAFGRRQVLNPEHLDMNDVVASVEPMLRRLIGENIEMTTRMGAGLGTVTADRTQLAQVLINLAVNARDAMPDGGHLTIETGAIDLDAEYAAEHAGVNPGHYALLSVTDDGVGMDPATKSRIFEPFFTTKPIGHGTGLGLATVHGIVEQSGGRIWVYSEPDRGTTFKVYLPATAESPTLNAPARPSAPRGHGEVVLVTEDDESIRSLARISLERFGYRVIVAGHPDEALEMFHSTPVAVLVTDVVMPGRSGIELANVIRASNPSLPVVFMSGYASAAIDQQGALDGGDVYLPKPFTPDDLARAVARALEPKSGD
ncbi:MAG: PAS domain S-box protein [Chloroflexi bacterium]|nr:PAS domain S-box protein [Chloroflexota bacterium]